MTYDELSRTLTSTDGKNQKTTFSYDKLDRLTSITYASTAKITYGYDERGNRTSESEYAAGGALTRSTTHTFDALNRRTRTQSPEDDHRYTYDATSNMTSYTDSGGTVRYTYDPVRNLTSVAEPGHSCLSDTGTVYNTNGNIPPATVKCTVLSYDANDKIELMRYPTRNTAAGADPADRGAWWDPTRDDSGRITTVVGQLWPRTSRTIMNLTYAYTTGAGDTSLVQRITDQPEGVAAVTRTPAYDGANRLTQLKTTSSTGTVTEAESFCYDKAGNLTTYSRDTALPACSTLAATRTYNSGNQLTSLGAGARSFTGTLSGTPVHDDNGSQTTGPAIGASPARTHLYNERDQDIQVNSITNTYAGSSQAQRLSHGSTRFAHAALGTSWWAEGTATDADITYATRTPDGQLISLRTGKRNTITTTYTSRYPFTDNLGSVRALIRDDQTISTTHRYSAYGEDAATTNPNNDTYTNRIRFTGGYLDTTTGLYKLGIRYYDPTQTRFTQPDPTGQDPHYTYARNDPCNFIDPSGSLTCRQSVFLAAVGVGLLAMAGVSFIAAAGAATASTATVGAAATVEFIGAQFSAVLGVGQAVKDCQ